MLTLRRSLILSASLLCLAAMPARAEEATFTDAQKTQIQEVIKSYLMENPNVIAEAMQAYQLKMQQEKMVSAEKALTDKYDELTAKGLPSAGNPDGDVTIVEFYDYNCGYCKKAFTDVTSIIETDKNVRVVFMEMAILGPPSEVAARWSQAAHKQGKFFEFHKGMMTSADRLDEAGIEQLATSIGMDVAKAKTDVASEEVKTEIAKHRELALSLGIQGTPGFVIGKKLYPGYIGDQGMKDAVKLAREAKK